MKIYFKKCNILIILFYLSATLIPKQLFALEQSLPKKNGDGSFTIFVKYAGAGFVFAPIGLATAALEEKFFKEIKGSLSENSKEATIEHVVQAATLLGLCAVYPKPTISLSSDQTSTSLVQSMSAIFGFGCGMLAFSHLYELARQRL